MEVRRTQLGSCLLQGRFRVSGMADAGCCNGQMVLARGQRWRTSREGNGRYGRLRMGAEEEDGRSGSYSKLLLGRKDRLQADGRRRLEEGTLSLATGSGSCTEVGREQIDCFVGGDCWLVVVVAVERKETPAKSEVEEE
jgi:hypothetical protein